MINLLLSLFIATSNAQQIKIAVIDTGYDLNSTWPDAEKNGLVIPKLCDSGHKSFVSESIEDKHGHGTHVAGLIAKYADGANYCLLIYKYYSEAASFTNMAEPSNKAIRAAIDAKVDVINYSGGGEGRDSKECSLIKEALDKNIKVVAAAGNRGANLAMRPFFPAMCDDRVTIVENVDSDGIMHYTSNYDLLRKNVKREVGVNAVSLLPNDGIGRLTGTSQATAIATGKLVKTLDSSRRANERISEKASK